MSHRASFSLLTMLLACVVGSSARVVQAEPQREPTKEEIEANKKEADKIIEAARKAGQNGMDLAKAIKDGNAAAANKFVGQEINVGGKPTKRTPESWTIDCRWGITVVATKIKGSNDPNVRLEEDMCAMWGTVKSIDMKGKSVTLEDTELIYIEYMPALHKDEKK